MPFGAVSISPEVVVRCGGGSRGSAGRWDSDFGSDATDTTSGADVRHRRPPVAARRSLTAAEEAHVLAPRCDAVRVARSDHAGPQLRWTATLGQRHLATRAGRDVSLASPAVHDP